MSDNRHNQGEYAASRMPHAGDRVRIEGREGVGVILCVHREAGTVDVLRLGGVRIRQVENGVPAEKVQVLTEEVVRGEVA